MTQLIKNTSADLNLIEIFASVQGETSFAGFPTTFVRLAACNLRCSWCDTPYSFGKGTPYPISAITGEVEKNKCRHVCITGGEPLLQKNVHLLMSTLCDKGYTLSLETGGSLSISQVDPRVHVILDIKCPGSGMSNKNDWSNICLLKQKDEVKFVILDEDDYLFSKRICEEHKIFGQAGSVLFSPVHGKLDPKDLLAWILRDKIPVRLNLQLHKFIWHPETKGV